MPLFGPAADGKAIFAVLIAPLNQQQRLVPSTAASHITVLFGLRSRLCKLVFVSVGRLLLLMAFTCLF